MNNNPKRTGILRFGIFLVILIILSFPAFTQTVTINTDTTYQTMEGFGGAITWYNNWLTGHPYKEYIYSLIFDEMGLDLLRVKNNYRWESDFDPDTAEIVQVARAALGDSLTLFMSSWTPPADLKVNGVINGGTIIQEGGEFVYDRFADYWYQSLIEYANIGVVPDYISIQNEPDYENSTWESCIFKAAESGSYPGYGIALDAVHNRIQGMTNPPGIISPEVTGIGSNLVQNYAANIYLSQVDVIAFHLYNGGDGNNPDSFNSNFQAIQDAFPDIPKWQTEYDYGTPYNTAQLIHNAVVNGNVSAYVFWSIIWGATAESALVELANPWDSSTWKNDLGYVVNDYYYFVKHYTKYIDKGFQRVDATVSTSGIRVSAFKSPASDKLTVVLLNDGSEVNVSLDISGFSVGESAVYSSSGTNMFSYEGSLGSGNSVTLPNQSATTIVVYDPSFGSPEPTMAPTDTPAPTPTPTPYNPPNAYDLIEAEDFSDMNGIQLEGCSEGGLDVAYIENNDWIAFQNLDFYEGISGIDARVATQNEGGTIEVRLDNNNGTLLGSVSVPSTGSWQSWTTVTSILDDASGVQNIYLVFKGGSGYLFNFSWFQIYGTGVTVGPTESPTPSPTIDPDNTPTPTPTPAPPVTCDGVSVWDSATVYADTGMRVQYNGNLYENNWYTQNQNPEAYSGEYDVWTLIGSCEQGTATPTPESQLGDVDEDETVTIVDALLVAQYYVGLPVDINTTNADTNCNSAVDIVDALLIAQYYVGLISEFSC